MNLWHAEKCKRSRYRGLRVITPTSKPRMNHHIHHAEVSTLTHCGLAKTKNRACLWERQVLKHVSSNFRNSKKTQGQVPTLDSKMFHAAFLSESNLKWWEAKGLGGNEKDLGMKCGVFTHQLLVLHVVLLFNQAFDCNIGQQDVTVIKKPVLQLKDQTAGINIALDFVWGFMKGNTKRGVTHWKRRLPGRWWLLWTPKTPTELSCGNSVLHEASNAYCSPEDLQTGTQGKITHRVRTWLRESRG